MERYNAIYGRQSVDRADSISIESQIEFCQYEARGEDYKIYQDKGYSGKNTDRPQFQEMLTAIRQGKIKRVIVYKLDRISRSILDFATMMEEFQEHGVGFISCTEKFDTATPMGRAMLNICIVFAQLERETIQMRVRDAYSSRSKKGFYMGGRIPYGYKLEPYTIDGKRTSHYVVEPAEAEIVKLIFGMYAEPQTSYGDIVKHLFQNQIYNTRSRSGYWDRCRIAEMIKNPIYVKSDFDVYEFYKSQGAILENDSADYMGGNGCYLYTGEGAGRKTVNLEGQHIVLAPHDGIVPADIWLKARLKCLNNKQVAKPLKAKNSWLVGKVKCGKCGYALTIKKAKTRIGRYFICSHHLQTLGCEGVGGINAGEFEDFILQQMKERLNAFGTLSTPEERVEDPKMLELKIKILQVQDEIEKLIDKLSDADSVLMSYIQKRVSELDDKKKKLQEQLRELSPLPKLKDIKAISNYIKHWDKLAFDDKRGVVDALILVVKATETDVEIQWKI